MNVLISQPKHMLWLFKRTVLYPKHIFKLIAKKISSFLLKMAYAHQKGQYKKSNQLLLPTTANRLPNLNAHKKLTHFARK